MSVWKKASKANQKIHRERHQPESRKHLGLLEKKKDYKKRATDYNEKKATLKLLRKRALNKNPDEFYHHMTNIKFENGTYFEKEKEEDVTPEQLRLMRTQDLRYITLKRTQEMRKIEKLQAELHLTSVGLQDFVGSPDMNVDIDLNALQEAVRNKKALYKLLSRRIERERLLAVTQRKVEMKKCLEQKTLLKPKRVKKGTKNSAPVYLWKYERKK